MQLPIVLQMLLIFAFYSRSSGFVSQSKVSKSISFYSSPTEEETAILQENESYLTPKLKQLCEKFALMADNKIRYQELSRLAQQLPPAEESIKIPENFVEGCQSTVYVDCTAKYDQEKADYLISYDGFSDGLVTRGQLTFLVQGFEGHTAAEIAAVDPSFIHLAKIDQTLTESRTNGYKNMLQLMQEKAQQVSEKQKQYDIENPETASSVPTNMYEKIIFKIKSDTDLKASRIEVVDESEEGTDDEFSVFVVSDLFEGVPVIKRHGYLHQLLAEEMEEADIEVFPCATSDAGDGTEEDDSFDMLNPFACMT